MKIRIIIFSFIYLSILEVTAQNTAKNEIDLIGQWQFVKMVDGNNKKLNPFAKSANYNPKFKRLFPDMVFNRNGIMIIDPEHRKPLKANWNWISDSKIEIIEILAKDSDRFKFPNRFVNNKKEIESDEKGNYILRDTLQIEWIKKNKIKVYKGKTFFEIYKKNKDYL
ncbi:hypothetical protein ACGK9U_00995 [Mariniflexile sp. HNIBRBA6329]|uniref:hypothetical protein n=1 Tax=Mariniflexile sp. HNIBRBA6329 TaxID=3373088 RepID=UPI003744CA63